MSIQRFPAVNNSGSSEALFKGSWNADTNTPTLANTDSVTAGVSYYVSDAGSVDFGAGNITFEVGDIVINNGTLWSRIDATDAVISVAGKSGVVTLDADDISEGTTNKVFTNTLKTKLIVIEDGATADQTDTEIETAYNNRVAIATQGEAEAGTSTSVKRFTPERIKQAIAALAGGGGTIQDATTKAIKVKTEVGTAGNARGTNAVDLSIKRNSASKVASGESSFAVGENITASGKYSVASGAGANASGTGAFAHGGHSSTENIASGSYSVAMGYDVTATEKSTVALGEISDATAEFSIALGRQAKSYLNGQFSHSTYGVGSAFSSGVNQYSRLVAQQITTDATPKILSIRHPSNNTALIIPSGKSWRFVIELVAINTANGDTLAVTYVGAIKRVGSTTSLVGSVTERDKVNDAGASTWNVSVTANDTDESLEIGVTGEAAKTINWCAAIHLTEVS